MTLAGIAYGQPSRIAGYLQEDTLTRGDWSIAWIAQDVAVPVNFAYIAKNRDGEYCVAIRGTYPNPLSSAYWDDAAQDSPLGDMQPWPIGADDPEDLGPRISKGTASAFNNLIVLSDGTKTLQQAIEAIPSGARVYVTGHSLGGTLAPVIALWMTTLSNKLVANVYCFAGMTPGNAAFANLFGPGTALNGRVSRYSNTLDSVPYGWNDVLATRNFYEPGPSGGVVVEAAITLLALRLTEYGYTPIGTEVQLTGKLSPPATNCTLVSFVIENLSQHLPDTYLSLLGAPSLPFTIGFGSVVVPNDHPTAKRLGKTQMPVYYM
jgi:hypothetical protein